MTDTAWAECSTGITERHKKSRGQESHCRGQEKKLQRLCGTMELLNLLVVTEALSERVVHNPGILSDHLFLGLVEEILVEIVNEPGLAECLETEVHNPIPSVNSGRARGEVTDRLGHTGVQHLAMDRLVKVFK